MEAADPRTVRLVPHAYADEERAACHLLRADWRFAALGEALDRARPRAVGMLLPFSWQLHWHVYKGASERGIRTAVAMPSNPGALTGLLRSVPIEAVVANDAGARAFHEDLKAHGLLERIRLWAVLSPKDVMSGFRAEHGDVIHIPLP